jgi:hypothetical protein
MHGLSKPRPYVRSIAGLRRLGDNSALATSRVKLMQRSSTLSAKIRSAIFEEGTAAGESGHSVIRNPYLHDDTDK